LLTFPNTTTSFKAYLVMNPMTRKDANKGRLPTLGKGPGQANWQMWEEVVGAHFETTGTAYTTLDKEVFDPRKYKDPEELKQVQGFNKESLEECLAEALEKMNDHRLMQDKDLLNKKLPPLPLLDGASEEEKKTYNEAAHEVQCYNDVVRRLQLKVYKGDCAVARSTILPLLQTGDLRRIKGVKDPAIIWSTLKEFHTGQNADNINVLLGELQGTYQTDFTSMSEYLSAMWDLFSRLSDAGGQMTERQFCLLLIRHLDDAYEMQGEILQGNSDLDFMMCEIKLLTTETAKKAKAKRAARLAPKKTKGDSEDLFTRDRVEAMVAQALMAAGVGDPVQGYKNRKKRTKVPGAPPGECYNWRDHGVCPFGQGCRFSHKGPKGRQPLPDLSESEE
jgi:hypothetical protein